MNDAFAGSGTVLIAAEKTGRTSLSIEIDPSFCDVVLARWETLTNRKTQLVVGSAGG